MSAVERARIIAWRAKKRALPIAKSAVPRFLRYADYTSIQFVREAWPPLAVPYPAPYVFRPAGDARAWLDKNRFFVGRPIILPPIQLNVIPRGIIFPDTGTMATSDGTLLEETSKDRSITELTTTLDRLRIPPRRLAGDVLTTSVVIGKLQKSYGHWVLDAVPRVHALGLVNEPVRVLLPDTVTGVKRRLIELAAPKNVSIEIVDAARPIRVHRALLTPFTTIGGIGLMRPEIAAWMRTKLVDAARARVTVTRTWPRFIYVSREKARWSRVENEDELKRALVACGVTSVVAEDLSIEEQILHFANADVVVGALGSGLVNSIFQARGELVEVFAGGDGPDTDPVSVYDLGVAISSGLRYTPIFHRHPSPEPHFRVDVDRVVAAVNAAMARVSHAG